MVDFWSSLKDIKDFVIPTLGAVAGFVVTSYSVRTRVKKLEKEIKALSNQSGDAAEDSEKRVLAELTRVRDGFLSHIDLIKDDVSDLERSVNQWQRQSGDFAKDDELNKFIQEQQHQWQAIQRTLGQIEGVLKRYP